MRRLISYPISPDMPGWPGNPTYSAAPFESMEQGMADNTYTVTLYPSDVLHIPGTTSAPTLMPPGTLQPTDRLSRTCPLTHFSIPPRCCWTFQRGPGRR